MGFPKQESATVMPKRQQQGWCNHQPQEHNHQPQEHNHQAQVRNHQTKQRKHPTPQRCKRQQQQHTATMNIMFEPMMHSNSPRVEILKPQCPRDICLRIFGAQYELMEWEEGGMETSIPETMGTPSIQFQERMHVRPGQFGFETLPCGN